jgi:methylated-DNA-protein-cysteine methyltransferase-like protein
MVHPKTKNEDFANAVYALVRLIPKGRVTSYGAIAKALGAAKSSRMVGYVLNKSFGVEPLVPAHRVVNRTGILTGKHYFGSPTKMQELLEQEGVFVINDKIENFDKLFWNPLREL